MAGVYTSLDWDNLPGGVNSTAPNGVRRGAPAGRGWTGSKAETQGGPGRAGRRSKMYGWKLVTVCANRQLYRNYSATIRDSPFRGLSRIECTEFSGPSNYEYIGYIRMLLRQARHTFKEVMSLGDVPSTSHRPTSRFKFRTRLRFIK